jgi:hypothetical protein
LHFRPRKTIYRRKVSRFRNKTGAESDAPDGTESEDTWHHRVASSWQSKVAKESSGMFDAS